MTEVMRMRWVEPIHSRNQVNKAGDILINVSSSEDDRAVALDILNNWRSSHSYPINTFQANLRRKGRDVASEALVAQRLKRVPSIIAKLQRWGTMKLARMQDIGGLRAVVRTVRQVQKLRDSFILRIDTL